MLFYGYGGSSGAGFGAQILARHAKRRKKLSTLAEDAMLSTPDQLDRLSRRSDAARTDCGHARKKVEGSWSAEDSVFLFLLHVFYFAALRAYALRARLAGRQGSRSQDSRPKSGQGTASEKTPRHTDYRTQLLLRIVLISSPHSNIGFEYL